MTHIPPRTQAASRQEYQDQIVQSDPPTEIDVRLIVAVAALLVSLFSLLFGPRIARDIVAKFEREKFRAFIDTLAGKIGRMGGADFAFRRHHDWPGMKGMAELESRVIDVTPRIAKRESSRFSAAVNAYRAVTFYNDKEAECEKQRLELIRLLAEMRACAK